MVLKRKLPSKQGLKDQQGADQKKADAGTDFVADDFPKSPKAKEAEQRRAGPKEPAQPSEERKNRYKLAEEQYEKEQAEAAGFVPEAPAMEEPIKEEPVVESPKDGFADFDASDFTEARSVDSPYDLAPEKDNEQKDFTTFDDSGYDAAKEPEFNKVQYHNALDGESQLGQPSASVNSGDDWDLDPASFLMNDVKGESKTLETPKMPPKPSGSQPWQTSGGSAPEIPQSQPAAAHKGNPFAALFSLIIFGGILAGVYYLFENKEKVTEIMARWTGALNEVSGELPQQKLTMEGLSSGIIVDDVRPDEVVIMPKTAPIEIEVKSEPPLNPPIMDGQVIATTEDDLLDEDTEEESNVDIQIQPKESVVVGKPKEEPSEAEEMPKEVSAFAALQSAIMKKREQKNEANDVSEFDELMNEPVNMKNLNKFERRERRMDMQAELTKELEKYRQELVKYDDPSLMPKPGEFFSGEYNEQLKNRGKNQLDPNYEDESIIPKVTAPETPGVRTLNAFEEYMFEPEKQKIRMPKKMNPWVSGAAFPQLELLSIIPNYGIIGLVSGNEGVLLLGDEIQGWELVAAESNYAEFRKDGRKQVLSLDHANR